MPAKINPSVFIHDMDRRALENLKAIPGFTPLLRAFMKIYSSHTLKITNLSSKIHLSPEQCPRLYNLVVPICEKFGIEVPDMYLEMDRSPNAYTAGDTETYVCITVTTGLLEIMDDRLVSTVLAHEVGHIVCHHVLYHTMGSLLLEGGAALLGLGPFFTEAINIAFAYWMRCSEFSADRCAAIYDGEPDSSIEVMMRFAGGSREVYDEINKDLFLAQAEDYFKYVDSSTWNKALEFWELRHHDHPFSAVRAREAYLFAQSKAFKNITDRLSGKEMVADKSHCPHCGAPLQPGHRFCKKCGKKVDED
ncbi:MAG: M48 family metallopeptidase [Bacilli bacterium]|nr:M48 family metallopeptidase [Bacilli bacterium]